MSMTEKIKIMLDLQSALNVRTKGVNWRDADFPWYRAIWTESAELMDAVTWKWWKTEVVDESKIFGELADIWHFILSASLQTRRPIDELAHNMSQWMQAREFPEQDDPLLAIEGLVLLSLNRHPYGVFGPEHLAEMFASILLTCGMPFNELYRQYVGKNVLNDFRQRYGYADGVEKVYSRTWSDGRDDNEHLADILGEVDVDSPGFRTDVFIKLETRYFQSA